MKTRLAIALIAISLLAAGRQGTLSGRVTGPDGPLEDVTVTITNGTISYRELTDRAGRFAFANLRAAHYDLTAQKKGYESLRQRYVVDDGKQTNVDLKLAAATPR